MSAFSQTLNKLVLIQAPGTTRDEAGGVVDSWTPFAAPWADIRNTGGLETILAGAVTSSVKTSIRLRYRLDINATMRVVHRTTIYKILAVLPDEMRRQHVDLVCEVVNA